MPTGSCEVQAEQPADPPAYPVRFKPLLGSRRQSCPATGLRPHRPRALGIPVRGDRRESPPHPNATGRSAKDGTLRRVHGAVVPAFVSPGGGGGEARQEAEQRLVERLGVLHGREVIGSRDDGSLRARDVLLDEVGDPLLIG